MQENKITSKIVTKNGAQYIEVNGEVLPGLAYITYLRDNNRYESFAKAGYKLFSTVVFFGKNKLNENSGLDFFSEGIFDTDPADFSGFDRDIENILKVCPDAYIFPRVNTSPSEMWEAAHPDELCDEGSSSNPERHRACLASDLYAEEVKKNLDKFIDHIESMHYANHIIGYQLVGGNTEEWIPYDGSAFTSKDPFVRRTAFIGKRSREKYEKYISENALADTDEEFYNFHAQIVADRMLEFSEFVKKKTGRRLIVGCFYGYTFELARKNGMHQRLTEVLKSDAVDFFCSPVSYAHTRPLGIEHAYMVPLSTLKLRGKLYFSENDTRTHLSTSLNDIPAYNLPIWFGHPKEGTLDVLKMHYSRALINGHYAWWFDMWGGWYEDPDYMKFMSDAIKITKDSFDTPSESVAEIAVFVDENSLAKTPDNAVTAAVIGGARRSIGLIGAPKDYYLAEDFELVKDKYKAYITLVPSTTDLSEKIKEYAKMCGKGVYEITPDNADVSSSELREFCRSHGVFIYSEKDTVTYANESYVFIHTGADGDQELKLPVECELIDVFEEKAFPKKFTSPMGKSYLLRKVVNN